MISSGIIIKVCFGLPDHYITVYDCENIHYYELRKLGGIHQYGNEYRFKLNALRSLHKFERELLKNIHLEFIRQHLKFIDESTGRCNKERHAITMFEYIVDNQVLESFNKYNFSKTVKNKLIELYQEDNALWAPKFYQYFLN